MQVIKIYIMYNIIIENSDVKQFYKSLKLKLNQRYFTTYHSMCLEPNVIHSIELNLILYVYIVH